MLRLVPASDFVRNGNLQQTICSSIPDEAKDQIVLGEHPVSIGRGPGNKRPKDFRAVLPALWLMISTQHAHAWVFEGKVCPERGPRVRLEVGKSTCRW